VLEFDANLLNVVADTVMEFSPCDLAIMYTLSPKVIAYDISSAKGHTQFESSSLLDSPYA
jgi:hypothetical protein